VTAEFGGKKIDAVIKPEPVEVKPVQGGLFFGPAKVASDSVFN